MSMTSNMALVTGASAGVVAIDASILAGRGHDLVPVGSRRDRFGALAARLRTQRGRNLERTRPWLDVEPTREDVSGGLREGGRPETRRAGPGTTEGG